MKSCILLGGSGFVGTHLARRFLSTGRFSSVHIADIEPTPLAGLPGITYSETDVRQSIPADLTSVRPEWIFNLAAVHREPGHHPWEYYHTNIAGARNVCDYAEDVRCDNIYFTSSIAVYGPTAGPTDEDCVTRPTTAYGNSKGAAEEIHQMWHRAGPDRRLLISRPAVLYGPGDPGNIMRMIKAIKRGYFAFPGSPSIHKSYGYISGFADSIDFLIDRGTTDLTYNYAESPTQSLEELVDAVRQHFQCRAVAMPIPLWMLLPVSKAIQTLYGESNPIHPVRVRKAATATHIVPRRLSELGFESKYSFLESLAHWCSVAPEDFGLPAVEGARRVSLVRQESSAAVEETEEMVDAH